MSGLTSFLYQFISGTLATCAWYSLFQIPVGRGGVSEITRLYWDMGWQTFFYLFTPNAFHTFTYLFLYYTQLLFRQNTSKLSKNCLFKIVPKPNSPLKGFILLRKTLRKNKKIFQKIKKIEIRTWAKMINFRVIHCLLHKIFGEIFWIQKVYFQGVKRGRFFDGNG